MISIMRHFPMSDLLQPYTWRIEARGFKTISVFIVETELYPIVFKVTAVFLKCTFGPYFGIERLSRLRDFCVDEKPPAEFVVEFPITCVFKVSILPFTHKMDANLCERLSRCTSLTYFAMTVKLFDWFDKRW